MVGMQSTSRSRRSVGTLSSLKISCRRPRYRCPPPLPLSFATFNNQFIADAALDKGQQTHSRRLNLEVLLQRVHVCSAG